MAAPFHRAFGRGGTGKRSAALPATVASVLCAVRGGRAMAGQKSLCACSSATHCTAGFAPRSRQLGLAALPESRAVVRVRDGRTPSTTSAGRVGRGRIAPLHVKGRPRCMIELTPSGRRRKWRWTRVEDSRWGVPWTAPPPGANARLAPSCPPQLATATAQNTSGYTAG